MRPRYVIYAHDSLTGNVFRHEFRTKFFSKRWTRFYRSVPTRYSLRIDDRLKGTTRYV